VFAGTVTAGNIMFAEEGEPPEGTRCNVKLIDEVVVLAMEISPNSVLYPPGEVYTSVPEPVPTAV